MGLLSSQHFAIGVEAWMLLALVYAGTSSTTTTTVQTRERNCGLPIPHDIHHTLPSPRLALPPRRDWLCFDEGSSACSERLVPLHCRRDTYHATGCRDDLARLPDTTRARLRLYGTANYTSHTTLREPGSGMSWSSRSLPVTTMLALLPLTTPPCALQVQEASTIATRPPHRPPGADDPAQLTLNLMMMLTTLQAYNITNYAPSMVLELTLI